MGLARALSGVLGVSGVLAMAVGFAAAVAVIEEGFHAACSSCRPTMDELWKAE
jgi:hypothetical protein